jgi:hypothetical protein
MCDKALLTRSGAHHPPSRNLQATARHKLVCAAWAWKCTRKSSDDMQERTCRRAIHPSLRLPPLVLLCGYMNRQTKVKKSKIQQTYGRGANFLVLGPVQPDFWETRGRDLYHTATTSPKPDIFDGVCMDGVDETSVGTCAHRAMIDRRDLWIFIDAVCSSMKATTCHRRCQLRVGMFGDVSADRLSCQRSSAASVPSMQVRLQRLVHITHLHSTYLPPHISATTIRRPSANTDWDSAGQGMYYD